ncbi:Rv3235 family protein [Actinoplanes sp. NPDC051475]|uniref:Rv3235 family protein n=1 Tax=Actinoplanes sp. NPDC051475 TaxID=3157225 RepID=UPI0034500085
MVGASPDAKLAVRRFVGSCVEVLNGYRPAAHLRRLAQPREAATVVAQGLDGAKRVAEARRLHTRFRRPAPVAVLRSSLCEPRPGAVEAAVLLLIGDRTWAMALRLEQHDEAWLATVLRLI